MSPDIQRPERIHILTAGVDQYDDEQIPNLNCASFDAMTLWTGAHHPGRGVYGESLANPKVEKTRKALSELLEDVEEDDLVLCFYSGHGLKSMGLTGTDTKYDPDEEAGDPILPMEDYAKPFRECRAKALFILDSCHAGEAIDSATLKAQIERYTGEGKYFLASSRSDQISYEPGQSRHSLLMKHFFEVFGEKEGEREINVLTGISEVMEKVRAEAKEKKWDQTVQIYGQGGIFTIPRLKLNRWGASKSNVIIGNQMLLEHRKKATSEEGSPFPYLSSYDIRNRHHFFGREKEVAQVLAAVDQKPLTLVIGRSGVGKSSLINAGVVPALAEEGYTSLTFRDYSNPLQQLKDFLRDDLPGVEKMSLLQILQAVHRRQPQPVVIVFDQFERFFTGVASADRLAFIQEFKACIDTLPPNVMNIVISFRSDFFGDFQEAFEEVIPTLIDRSTRINLKELDKTKALEIVKKSLSGERIAFKTAFAEEMIDELSGEEDLIFPPYLQIVCHRLHERASRRSKDEPVVINAAFLEEEGFESVSQILSGFIDDTIDDISGKDMDRKRLLRGILKMMTTSQGTRRFVDGEALERAFEEKRSENIHECLQALIERRLVEVKGEDPVQYSMVHEVMVEKVKKWFSPAEKGIQQARETMERGVQEFESNEEMMTRNQVALVRKWLSGEEISEKEHELLVTSEAVHEEEDKKIASNEKRWFFAKWAVVIILFLTAGYSFRQWRVTKDAKEKEVDARKDLEEKKKEVDQANADLKNALKGEEKQKNEALRTQSLFLADLARQQIDAGRNTEGILLCLEGAPKVSNSKESRPLVAELMVQLNRALRAPYVTESQSFPSQSEGFDALSPDEEWCIRWDKKVGEKIVMNMYTGEKRNWYKDLSNERKGHDKRAISSGGKWVVLSRGKKTWFYDGVSGTEIAQLTYPHQNDDKDFKVRGLYFLGNSDNIFISSIRGYVIYSLTEKKPIAEYNSTAKHREGLDFGLDHFDRKYFLQSLPVSGVASSLNGVKAALIESNGETVNFINAQTGRLEKEFNIFSSHERCEKAFYLSDNQHIALVRRDQRVAIVDTKVPDEVRMPYGGNQILKDVVNVIDSKEGKYVVFLRKLKGGTHLSLIEVYSASTWNKIGILQVKPPITTGKIVGNELTLRGPRHLLKVRIPESDRYYAPSGKHAFSEDGSVMMASSREGTAVKAMKTKGLQVLSHFEDQGETVLYGSYTKDRKRLITFSRNKAYVRNPNNYEIQTELKGIDMSNSTDFIDDIYLLGDCEHVIIRGKSQKVAAWNLRTGGEPIVKLDNPNDEVSAIELNASHTAAFFFCKNKVYLWRIGEKNTEILVEGEGDFDEHWMTDDRLLIITANKIQVFDVSNAKNLVPLTVPESFDSRKALLGRSKHWLQVSDGINEERTLLYNFQTKKIHKVPGIPAHYDCVVDEFKRMLYRESGSRDVVLYDIINAKEIARYEGAEILNEGEYDSPFTKKRNRFLVEVNKRIKICDIETGRVLSDFPGGLIKNVTYALSENHLLHTSAPGEVTLRSLETGKILNVLEQGQLGSRDKSLNRISTLLFSQDGKYAVIASGRSAALFRTETGDRISDCSGFFGEVQAFKVDEMNMQIRLFLEGGERFNVPYLKAQEAIKKARHATKCQLSQEERKRFFLD